MNAVSDEFGRAVEAEYASFVKREPVVLTHLIGGPVAGLVTLFAPGDPSSTAEQITAGVVAFALVLQGFLVRRFVSPAWQRETGRPLPYPHGDSRRDARPGHHRAAQAARRPPVARPSERLTRAR